MIVKLHKKIPLEVLAENLRAMMRATPLRSVYFQGKVLSPTLPDSRMRI